MTTARWNGRIIAESDRTTIVEGNHYFPLAAVRAEYLEASETTTVCPWKGMANYYDLAVDGERNPEAAWYYAEPSLEAAHIRHHVAFWRGVQITD
ncbi:uncharacterized protein (DUF427 family) [Kitasatospora sp. MAA4]|uniref:DUF427 domain-containing protein n=1 Tax=Kitasatospora sp. MAA4 TaxID=3035093 RepID=UPI0024772A54|nr:DUF427 domain-containing protein [Kitasatospora sp. MAA4]MDH6132005.1 uncharacterized protein (DUF427 family) [Kitasatospora sp. MAA4]